MRVPPYAVAVRVAEDEHTRFRIWVPVFILWPLLLVLGLPALALVLLVDGVLLACGRRHGYTALLLGCVDAVAESRGAEVFVNSKNRTVMVTVR
jgi:hypothetical protein